jgi:hypothetical protein
MPTSITRMVCDVRIGASGFHYKHWKGSFYPERMPSAAMLEFQVQKFDTVELNNSFYRPADCRGLPRELQADVRDSHHSLAQLVQRILRAAPFDPIIPQCENHRAQKRIDEQCRAYRVKQEIIRGHG